MKKRIMYSEVSGDPPKANDLSLLSRLKNLSALLFIKLLPRELLYNKTL